ncbi:hypothetical protein P0Y43_22450 [Pseudomonas entomophila]|uniref:hypothetical protein n=1 Tax=Pseudomonas entomophila TaxID=312306 RepID=UPI0023D89324|nr:hypothetical protein [Pseudomonas entomophila]MDF0733458.1 hypothetical protein [Pseudomonas entomophila]
MSVFTRQFKLSGRVAALDQFHQIITDAALLAAPDEHYIAPTVVKVNIVYPQAQTIGVPQYSPTVVGEPAGRYDPAGDCHGNFMSYKFQPNNNCYAYGCNITPNTFPQPGRQSGYLLTAADFKKSVADLGALVSSYAVKDGLVLAGRNLDELMKFKSSKQGTNPGVGVGGGAGYLAGHFVALMVSPAGDANWPGDYHWARCDNSSGACDSWSQKDGSDQVTNFDFAGNAIKNPATANWTVNQGPVSSTDKRELVANYEFYCFMFVPEKGVNII